MNRIWAFIKSQIKIPLVFAAFTLLVVSGCIITYRTLSNKLLEHANETINDLQDLLSSEMTEPEIALHFFADTIEGMIERGEAIDDIKAYMVECSTSGFKKKIHLESYKSVFGFFDVYDEFYDGVEFNFPDGFAFRERPWYTNALEGGREVVLSKVYMDARMSILTMFYSRSMFDSKGNFLGVLAISVPIQAFQKIITSGHFTPGSYGYIMDEDLVLLVHPNENSIGMRITDLNPNFLPLVHFFEENQDISMLEITDYRGTNSLLFCRKIHNNWYMSFMIPIAEYYHDLYKMIIIISLLGVFMASMLSILLVRIDTAKRKSEMENQQKSSFLAVMSHEIRTPMNAIMGITESQLQDDDKSLSAGVKEAFDRIYYSGSLLLQIINDLLDISKIEAGKLEIINDRYEVASLINEVVHINKIRFDSKPIEFKLNIDENIPASLIGDEIRIKQILNNLLSNAFKYTWKGEVKLSITSQSGKAGKAVKSGQFGKIGQFNIAGQTGSTAQTGGPLSDVTLVFTVSDTGQGISAQDLKNLYTEYARFNAKANRSTVGTGLGLNITKALVEMMHGDISVESEFGIGSTFTVRLPQKINGSSAVLGKATVDNLQKLRFSRASQINKQPINREQMPYGSVLIVDDVEMNLFVAKLLMKPYGLKIDTASSGYEAIDRIKNGNVYDVIFMDHMMPKMDGIEAINIIRSSGYTHPVIALTANAVAGQADIFFNNGFDDFISKPIDIRILNAALNKHIRDRRKEVDIQTNDPQAGNSQNQALQTEASKEDLMQQSSDSKPADQRSADQKLTEIPGLDFESGLEVFEGEIDDYISALHSFVKNTPEIMDKLRSFNNAANMPEYAVNVHGLKSISAWICAEDIRREAAELEALAKAGNADAVAARNGKFLDETEAFMKLLQSMLKSEFLEFESSQD